MTCPHCHEDARCKGFRCRTALTLLGVLRFPRHYYHCRHCGQGVSPLDQSLGLSAADLTPAADEVVCLAGVQDSFATAAVKVLTRLSGLRVSESTAERATEAAGRRVVQAQAAGRTFGPPTPWSWHKDADGKTVAYVSVDATGVGQQGLGGAAADGRMAYVGMIYNPVPQDRQAVGGVLEQKLILTAHLQDAHPLPYSSPPNITCFFDCKNIHCIHGDDIPYLGLRPRPR
ncbi:MAG TPA: hypothetical protein VKD72_22490 [Gemmataceae bacterium]|nr:hypothetical protein [Gemmataceae bacterium]